MDIGNKLMHQYLDAIEAAYSKGITPEHLSKLINKFSNKIPKSIEDKIVIGAIAYIGHDSSFKSTRNSIKKFIKSKDFRMMIPKAMQVKKKFFTGEKFPYSTAKALTKDLTAPEHRRYKFVEAILAKKFKESKNSKSKSGIMAHLKR